MFASFFQGGFECSTHVRADHKRLDVTAATQHDRLASRDYQLLAQLGLSTVRDGLRWHLIEKSPGRYDWDSFLPMLQAAREAGVQVVWDLLHFGWPDHVDVFAPDFGPRFAAFSAAAVELMKRETGETPLVCPINEISFLAWGGGDHALFNPHARRRGDELKRKLAHGSILSIKAVWSVDPGIRIIHTDPAINVVPSSKSAKALAVAQSRTDAQFHSFDMISGRSSPELGGEPRFLDVMGVNYYCHNQWVADGPPLDWEDPPSTYTPPRFLFERLYKRYGRPMFISETGIEAELRPKWLRYICDEVAAAIQGGVPIHGICIYPVMNHPGWDDDRHCPNGLIDYDRKTMERSVVEPMMDELRAQQARFADLLGGGQGAGAASPMAQRELT